MAAPPSKLVTTFSKPPYQVLLVTCMSVVFTLIDKLFPHNTELLEPNSGTWIVATAMIFCFIILNTVVAIRIEPILPYWSKSVMYYIGFLVFSYAWCYLLTGKQIDDVGSFRWLWLVLTMVYMVFFAIVRSMKRIVDFAIKQDKKLRGEE